MGCSSSKSQRPREDDLDSSMHGSLDDLENLPNPSKSKNPPKVPNGQLTNNDFETPTKNVKNPRNMK